MRQHLDQICSYSRWLIYAETQGDSAIVQLAYADRKVDELLEQLQAARTLLEKKEKRIEQVEDKVCRLRIRGTSIHSSL